MYSDLKNLITKGIVKENEPMSNHTTFKIGGPVDLMVFPNDLDEIKLVVKYCHSHKIPLFVFGFGSNLLVKDKGIRGIALKIGNNIKSINIEDTKIKAEAGIRLNELSKKAAAYNLSGLEFAEGIPGSLGGAVVMNAGAYDSEMKNVLVEVEAIDLEGNIKIFNKSEMDLGYRQSIFQKNNMIILSALMQLELKEAEEIKEKMRNFAKLRREKQPIEFPSAGSVFRRPKGFYVGAIIEEMGLKGFRIGGAEVSNKHAGFIINSGNATASDVIELIRYIQEKASEKYGVKLHPEIKIIGED